MCPARDQVSPGETAETGGRVVLAQAEINRALLVLCVLLVLVFRSSGALAAAYGIAVTGTMGITTVVYFAVLRRRWAWPLWKALPLASVWPATSKTAPGHSWRASAMAVMTPALSSAISAEPLAKVIISSARMASIRSAQTSSRGRSASARAAAASAS